MRWRPPPVPVLVGCYFGVDYCRAARIRYGSRDCSGGALSPNHRRKNQRERDQSKILLPICHGVLLPNLWCYRGRGNALVNLLYGIQTLTR